MCKRISLVYAIEHQVLPRSYLQMYGDRASGITVRVQCDGYNCSIEDPVRKVYRQISRETFEKLNGNGRKPKRPSRRTK